MFQSRTISQIQQQILTNKQNNSNLNGLTSTSQTAIWILWSYIVAVSINIFEQILSVFSQDIEDRILNHVAGTIPWYSYMLKNVFQYSDINPQIIKIDVTGGTFALKYDVVDPSLRIITQSAIETSINQVVTCKVAKSDPPQSLSSLEKNSVIDFLNRISPAGISTKVISVDPDQLYLKGNIYYSGLYSSTIQANVESAVNNYLHNIVFDGKLIISQLENAILKVSGVNDCKLDLISIRRYNQTFNSAGNTVIYKLTGNTTDINLRHTQFYAGYAITETATNYTISDSLQYLIN